MVWSVPKQEYNYAIVKMYLPWSGETAITKNIDEALSWLAKMAWYFQRNLARKLSNPDNEASFQANLYKNMNPKTAKDIIAATHHPNSAMHKISTSIENLPIHILGRNNIDKDTIPLENTCGGCERIFSSTVSIFYTCNNTRFLMVWVTHMWYSFFEMWVVVKIVCVVESSGCNFFHLILWHHHVFH